MNNKKILGFILGIIFIAVLGYIIKVNIHSNTPQQSTNANNQAKSSSVVKVVAAENFYGDVVKQLGGEHVSVTSILSDPNADPHEYESSVPDAVAVSQADIVLENGLEYDTWMDKLLSASPNSSRQVLIAGQIAAHPLPDNPHIWYGIDNMASIANAITSALKKADPADLSTFNNNLQTFNNSLSPLLQKIDEIKSKYQNTPVGLTETIYLYQTQAMSLNVLTPYNFEKALAEGNDPSVADVKTTNQQVQNKQIKVLIYNNQTVTPITTNLQNMAKQLGIPVVQVSETMPQDKTYQSWMLGQLNDLEQSLQQVVK
ncbi:MAG: zinc ABC transporter substrate-binding protein [Candidatus Doudnabacteria bacterium]|nr:zinc ABC transporter substrate-binding protein [Candidatus Doudnabacteria bacterium]